MDQHLVLLATQAVMIFSEHVEGLSKGALLMALALALLSKLKSWAYFGCGGS